LATFGQGSQRGRSLREGQRRSHDGDGGDGESDGGDGESWPPRRRPRERRARAVAPPTDNGLATYRPYQEPPALAYDSDPDLTGADAAAERPAVPRERRERYSHRGDGGDVTDDEPLYDPGLTARYYSSDDEDSRAAAPPVVRAGTPLSPLSSTSLRRGGTGKPTGGGRRDSVGPTRGVRRGSAATVSSPDAQVGTELGTAALVRSELLQSEVRSDRESGPKEHMGGA
jgi:hypothetical protein